MTVFLDEYLHIPTDTDITRLVKIGKGVFPGMLGSLERLHWTWNFFSIDYGGHYTGKEKEPEIILEAVA